MTLHDYIIDHRNVEWPTVLREWSWLVPPTFTVWMSVRNNQDEMLPPTGSAAAPL